MREIARAPRHVDSNYRPKRPSSDLAVPKRTHETRPRASRARSLTSPRQRARPERRERCRTYPHARSSAAPCERQHGRPDTETGKRACQRGSSAMTIATTTAKMSCRLKSGRSAIVVTPGARPRTARSALPRMKSGVVKLSTRLAAVPYTVRRFKLQAEAAWLGSRRAEAHARDATARSTRALVDDDATTRTFQAS